MGPRSACAARRFSLIELLVVIAVIATLAGLLLGALGGVRNKTARGAAESELRALRSALAQYRDETGGYPRLAPRRGDPDALLRDDAPALAAALLNRPTTTAGGGPNAPYGLAWKRYGVVVDRACLEADRMGKDGITGVEPLPSADYEQRHTAEVQARLAPTGPTPLVLLDPWGNPYHYRAWDRVAPAITAPLRLNPIQRTGLQAAPNSSLGDPIPGPVPDGPHDLEGVDMWSNGPNGVNEYGAPDSDDVVSWNR